MKMQDLSNSDTAGWIAALLYKLLPGGLGAAVMICVDPPKGKRELFGRLFVAFVFSAMLGDVAFDFLHSLSWFAFLDAGKRMHTVSVDFIVGGLGWFVIGGVSMWLKKFRSDPVAAVEDAKRVGP